MDKAPGPIMQGGTGPFMTDLDNTKHRPGLWIKHLDQLCKMDLDNTKRRPGL
jgi:hypothetical protein